MSEKQQNNPEYTASSSEPKYGAKITPETQWRLAGNTLTGGDPGAILEQQRKEKKLAQEAKQKEMLKAPGFVRKAGTEQQDFKMPELTAQTGTNLNVSAAPGTPGLVPSAPNLNKESGASYPSRRQRQSGGTAENNQFNQGEAPINPPTFPNSEAEAKQNGGYATASSYVAPAVNNNSQLPRADFVGAANGAPGGAYPTGTYPTGTYSAGTYPPPASPAQAWPGQPQPSLASAPANPGKMPGRFGPILTIVLGILAAFVLAPALAFGSLIYTMTSSLTDAKLGNNGEQVASVEVTETSYVLGAVTLASSTDHAECTATSNGQALQAQQIDSTGESNQISYAYLVESPGTVEFSCSVTDKTGQEVKAESTELYLLFTLKGLVIVLLGASGIGIAGIIAIISGIVWLVKRNKARRMYFFANMYRF